MNKNWDVSFTVNGFLAGLVAITCPCYWVSPTGSIMLGASPASWWSSASKCWSGCASTIRSARCRCTACAASGARFRSGFFACGKYGATGPFAADNSAPLKGLFYGGGTTVLVAQVIGSADRHRSDIRGGHGGDVRGQCDGSAARLRGRRDCTVWICTSTGSRPIRNTSSPPWASPPRWWSAIPQRRLRSNLRALSASQRADFAGWRMRRISRSGAVRFGGVSSRPRNIKNSGAMARQAAA